MHSGFWVEEYSTKRRFLIGSVHPKQPQITSNLISRHGYLGVWLFKQTAPVLVQQVFYHLTSLTRIHYTPRGRFRSMEFLKWGRLNLVFPHCPCKRWYSLPLGMEMKSAALHWRDNIDINLTERAKRFLEKTIFGDRRYLWGCCSNFVGLFWRRRCWLH